jgi:hypothetical protein
MENDIIHPNVKSSFEILEERFSNERIEWSKKITDMGVKLGKILEIPNLMITLYTERQRALEYYHYLISLLIGINKTYRKSYDERHDYYTNKIQVRYPNESTKHNRILVDLHEILQQRETLENHAKFILGTVSTIDNIIYAIPRRIEIEQISRGK